MEFWSFHLPPGFCIPQCISEKSYAGSYLDQLVHYGRPIDKPPMYGDLLLDQPGVNFLGPAPLDLELLHMLTTFHWNALGSTLGWWFCHNNTVSCNEKFWVEQVMVPHPPPPGEGQGVGNDKGGGVRWELGPAW